jgi:hypothetical protein
MFVESSRPDRAPRWVQNEMIGVAWSTDIAIAWGAHRARHGSLQTSHPLGCKRTNCCGPCLQTSPPVRCHRTNCCCPRSKNSSPGFALIGSLNRLLPLKLRFPLGGFAADSDCRCRFQIEIQIANCRFRFQITCSKLKLCFESYSSF